MASYKQWHVLLIERTPVVCHLTNKHGESSIQEGKAPSSTAPTFRSIFCLLGESLPADLQKTLGKDAPKKH